MAKASEGNQQSNIAFLEKRSTDVNKSDPGLMCRNRRCKHETLSVLPILFCV